MQEFRTSVNETHQKLHQEKRSNELAKNKISTATECLTIYLSENLKKDYFDEFNPVFKFLVSQFSSLLCQPQGYIIDPDSKYIKLSENLFNDILQLDPSVADKLSDFKAQIY